MPVTASSPSSILKVRPSITRWQFVFLLWLQALNVWAKDPATLYAMECQGCHLANGNGGLASIPALNGHVALFLDVSGGREYLARVPGVAQSTLSDEDLTGVLNWVLNRFGPAAALSRNPVYRVDEIAQLRQRPMTEVSKTRAALLLLIEQRAAGRPQR